MLRKHNTQSTGSAFSAATIEAVWQKALIVPGYSKYRKDVCGAWIHRDQYGNTNSGFGWEIDHKTPVALLGSDHIDNLQPLQWENNRHKGDQPRDRWSCKVSSA